MSEKIKKDIEEMVSKTVVTRDKSTLKALGVKGVISHSYRSLVIRLRDKEEIPVCSRTAEKIKTCLIKREKSEFAEEDIREDYTNFRRFIFDFNDDGALITIVEGTRYPVKLESLQPTPNERRIKVNNPEIVGIICVINKFLELQEYFYAIKEVAGKEIRNFLELQLKRKLKFIRGLAEKYKIEFDDALELIKDEIGIADDAFEIMKAEIDIRMLLDEMKENERRKDT
ncbi:hypothetical protein DRN97_00085 [Methanosarcinales archaeon]|nr:MAG: hypothetical protein DRN97_00085 [Methanosarcinales archaeon]